MADLAWGNEMMGCRATVKFLDVMIVLITIILLVFFIIFLVIILTFYLVKNIIFKIFGNINCNKLCSHN